MWYTAYLKHSILKKKKPESYAQYDIYKGQKVRHEEIG